MQGTELEFMVESLSDEELERLSKVVSSERLSRLLNRFQEGALERFDLFQEAFLPRLEELSNRIKSLF